MKEYPEFLKKRYPKTARQAITHTSHESIEKAALDKQMNKLSKRNKMKDHEDFMKYMVDPYVENIKNNLPQGRFLTELEEKLLKYFYIKTFPRKILIKFLAPQDRRNLFDSIRNPFNFEGFICQKNEYYNKKFIPLYLNTILRIPSSEFHYTRKKIAKSLGKTDEEFKELLLTTHKEFSDFFRKIKTKPQNSLLEVKNKIDTMPHNEKNKFSKKEGLVKKILLEKKYTVDEIYKTVKMPKNCIQYIAQNIDKKHGIETKHYINSFIISNEESKSLLQIMEPFSRKKEELDKILKERFILWGDEHKTKKCIQNPWGGGLITIKEYSQKIKQIDKFIRQKRALDLIEKFPDMTNSRIREITNLWSTDIQGLRASDINEKKLIDENLMKLTNDIQNINRINDIPEL